MLVGRRLVDRLLMDLSDVAGVDRTASLDMTADEAVTALMAFVAEVVRLRAEVTLLSEGRVAKIITVERDENGRMTRALVVEPDGLEP